MIELKPEWLAEPISCTCEVGTCDKPTIAAYPAMGGGWMALCAHHARKHLPHGAYLTDELIAKGAIWK